MSELTRAMTLAKLLLWVQFSVKAAWKEQSIVFYEVYVKGYIMISINHLYFVTSFITRVTFLIHSAATDVLFAVLHGNTVCQFG